MDLEISSRENSYYKELKKSIRENNGFICIEGKKLLNEALKSSVKLEKIFFDKSNKSVFENLLPKDRKTEIVFIKNELLSELFTTDSKPDSSDLVIGLAKKNEYKLADLFELKRDLIFLEEVQDPGNLGTIIRSALAFECSGVILSKSSVDPFSTKVIRASAGAVFKLPIICSQQLKNIYDLAMENKYRFIATSINKGKEITELNNLQPSVIAFGNEGRGLSHEIMDIASEVIKLPHSKEVESLNVGVAVSIVLWERYRLKIYG